MPSVLGLAAGKGNIKKVKSLLSEGGARIEPGDHASLALWYAVANGELKMATWLLEHGGASVTDVTVNERTVWDLLIGYIMWRDYDAAAVTVLLRAMLLKGSRPPVNIATAPSFSAEHVHVIHEGTRIRARLPAYLAQRRALLDEHSPLIPPLQALVCGYEEPTTTEELWATGLGKEL
jgi:hypothetical protein